MIQIWFGLIWVYPKDQNIKTSKKQIKHKETQNTCLFCTFIIFYFVTWAGTLNKEHEWWINLYILYQIATFLGFKILRKTFWIPIQDSRFKILRKTFGNPNPGFKILIFFLNPDFPHQDSRRGIQKVFLRISNLEAWIQKTLRTFQSFCGS